MAWAVLWFVLFHVFNTGLQLWLAQNLLNGSIFYIPTLLALLLMTWNSYRVAHPERRTFLLVDGVFVLSLVLRSVDEALCRVWPIGTHFLWHLLNAWVLYRLTAALLPTRPAPAASE